MGAAIGGNYSSHDAPTVPNPFNSLGGGGAGTPYSPAGTGAGNGGSGGFGPADGNDGGRGGGGGGGGYNQNSSTVPNGGAGGIGGGGGDGGKTAFALSNEGGSGGAGGFCGGGGGIGDASTSAGNGGNGGFGGGGGGGGDFNGSSQAGNGGFGGGGGTVFTPNSTGGTGGFGGGGGSGALTGGTGGIGGGQGGALQGRFNASCGGGAGFGGALFVTDGSTVAITGSLDLSGNGVTAGAGSRSGTSGAAQGSDLFIMTNSNVSFSPGTGTNMTIGTVIADDSSISLPGTSPITYIPGTATGAGLTMNGQGTLVLSAANTFAGPTTISSGTLALSGSGSIANSSGVSLTGTLDISGKPPGSTTTIANLSGNGPIHFGAGTTTLIVGGATSTSFGGVISGSGNVTINPNSATLTLTVANTYTGATTISSGTLALTGSGNIPNTSFLTINGTFDISGASNLTIPSLAGSGTISLGTHTLTINSSGDSTFSGTLSGSGGLQVTGGGKVSFTQASPSFTGTATISSGTLSVNSAFGGSVVIASSGLLKGTGSITGNVKAQSGGGISPGNSIGTLSVGSATFNSGSTFYVEIGTATCSLLSSTGNIDIASGAILSMTEDPGTYTVGDQFTIMTSGGTITSAAPTNFSTIRSASGFGYELSLDGLDKNLFLTILNIPKPIISSGISTQGVSGNSLVLANYLNSLQGYAPLSSTITALSQLSQENLNSALTTISPARNAFATFTLQNTAFSFSEMLSSRLGDVRFLRGRSHEKGKDVAALIAGPIMSETKESEGSTYSVWGSVIGAFAHENKQKQTPAFNMSTSGFVVGYDNTHFQDVLLGGSLGYAYISIHEKEHLGKQYLSDYTGSVYSSLYVGDLFFDLAAWGAYHNGSSQRKIFYPGFEATAKSHLQGWQVIPHFLFGYDAKLKNFTLEPFAQFDWAVNFERGIKEKGAGSLDMRQKAHTSSLLRSEIGLAVFKDFFEERDELFVVRGHLSYVNKAMFGTGSVNAAIVGAPGGTFFVETLNGNQNLFAPGVELFYETNKNIFFSLSYEGEFGDGYRANEALIKMGKAF